MFLDIAGLTDRGKVHRRNIDQLLIAELNKSVIIRTSTLPTEREKRLAAVTITIALLIWPAVFVVHRGTSRLYILRGRNLHNLTTDGAPGNSPGRSKQSTPELPSHTSRARESPPALTTPMGVRMHVHQATIAHGDTVLLCTDGLTTGVTDEQIAQVLREDRPADSACLSLIHAANDAGGLDNTSVIVARALDHG